MQMITANDIEASENKRKYDEQCKKVLSNKYILANILKYTVEEVENKSIKEIVSLIDGEPEVGIKGVLECTDKIIGENTEDTSVSEGTLYYDIRFSVRLGETETIKILFDIEAQKKYNPGYHIVTRGIVYGARMISSQIGTEFDLKHYDNVKKVYSIWICFDASKRIGNAISRYAIQKEDILLGIPNQKQAYDKLTVIEICLDEEKESEHKLVRMLNTLFSDKKNSKEIKDFLENDYEVPMNDNYGKEIELMCNLSGRVEEKGIKKGFAQGIEQGIEQGKGEGKAIQFIDTVEKLKESLSIPLEEVLRLMGKTMEDYVNAQKLLK